MTEKIQEFLTKFDDQHLANLQCAAEDGTLVYHNCNRCLLHHFRGEYSATKWESEHGALARMAEAEYRDLATGPELFFGISYVPFGKAAEDARRQAILPLIQAEWGNRAKRIKEIEELTPVSLSVR